MSESINKKLKEQESTDVNMDFSPAWIGGLSVVFVGAIFLLQNMGVIGSSGNWWAWFILISVFVSFSMAWRAYVHNGRQLTRFPRMMISSGVLTLCVALIFLAGMSWSVVWPGFLMVVGLGILFVNTA